MKYLFVLFLLFSSANADYLYTKYSNRCVYDLTPYQDNTGWCFIYSDTNNSSCNSRADLDDFIDGYFYKVDTDECLLKNDLKITNLTQNQWDYLLSVLAHVLGFTMLFLINFLAILVVRK